MSAVSSWILSIVGIVLLGLLVEILLPNGRTNKILKSVIAIFTVLIIISPLKNFSLDNLDISSWFKTSVEIDEDFVNNVNENKIKSLEGDISKNLDRNGYKAVVININGNFTDAKLNINNVYVDLKNLVLSDQNLNINKYTNIVAIIKSTINVSEESIVFYE